MVNVHSKHYIGETLCVNMTIFLLFTKIDVVLKCLKQKEKKSTTVLYSKFNKILTTNQFSKTFLIAFNFGYFTRKLFSCTFNFFDMLLRRVEIFHKSCILISREKSKQNYTYLFMTIVLWSLKNYTGRYKMDHILLVLRYVKLLSI